MEAAKQIKLVDLDALMRDVCKLSFEAESNLPQVPIMLRSTYCCLNDHTDKELTDLGECPYDQARLKISTKYMEDETRVVYAASKQLICLHCSHLT